MADRQTTLKIFDGVEACLKELEKIIGIEKYPEVVRMFLDLENMRDKIKKRRS